MSSIKFTNNDSFLIFLTGKDVMFKDADWSQFRVEYLTTEENEVLQAAGGENHYYSFTFIDK